MPLLTFLCAWPCSLFQLLAEARALQQMGVAISVAAGNLLAQEERVKHFRQRLELALEMLDLAVSTQDPLLRGLFAEINDRVKRYVPHVPSAVPDTDHAHCG